ncbi:MAG: SDR family oxidoreductase [Nitratireductor sp.]
MAIKTRGPFDVLFNNAGTNQANALCRSQRRELRPTTGINTRRRSLPAGLAARGSIAAGIKGSIIHTSSQMGHVGGIDRSVYCASKFAIEGLTKASAIELAAHGIRVNAIAPTFIRTPMTQSTFDDPERKAWVRSKIKLGRVGEVEDIMGAVLFLASDASALVTGTSMLVDGGWTAG